MLSDTNKNDIEYKIMKKNYIWNTIGGFTFALTSLFYSIILARLSTINNLGLYTFAFALACNTVTLASFGGRTYQITDVNNNISTFSYIICRYLTTFFTIICLLIYLILNNYHPHKFLLILLICIFKYMEEISDVYYAIIHKNGQLFFVGKYQFIKSIYNVLSFILLTYFFNNLFLTFVILILLNLIFLIVIERKKAKRIDKWEYKLKKKEIAKYFKDNIYICLLTFLSLFITTIPRLIIDKNFSTDLQAIFGIIIMPATVMVLISGFILNPLIVKIAKNYKEKKYKLIENKVRNIILIILLVGLLCLIGGYILGVPLFNFIYDMKLNNYKNSLILILIGSSFFAITSSISTILISMRKIKIQVFINLIVIIIGLILSKYLIINYKIFGAALAYLFMVTIRLILYYIVFKVLIKKIQKKVNLQKKKVLHVLSSNMFSGAENVVCTIIENNKKYDMFYCCPKGSIEQILKEKNIKYIPLKRLSPCCIKRICKKNNIDILHAHDYKASFCAAISGFKGKIISQLHVNWHFSSTWNLYTILYKLVMNKFYKIIAVSEEIVKEAVFVKNNEEKFVVIDNVVDKNNVIDKSQNFNTKSYDIIYVGRLTKVKRPELVIEITKKLTKKYPKIKTCVIGKGELEEECKNLIKKYHLEKNIDMLGFQNNPFPYIKNSKVALLPSLHEGLPMSVIECMILNTPVLNGGVDGLETLFKNNKEYICNNIDEYCKKIELILTNKINLNKDCNKIIKKHIDMNNYIKKINKLYEEEIK